MGGREGRGVGLPRNNWLIEKMPLNLIKVTSLMAVVVYAGMYLSVCLSVCLSACLCVCVHVCVCTCVCV